MGIATVKVPLQTFRRLVFRRECDPEWIASTFPHALPDDLEILEARIDLAQSECILKVSHASIKARDKELAVKFSRSARGDIAENLAAQLFVCR